MFYVIFVQNGTLASFLECASKTDAVECALALIRNATGCNFGPHNLRTTGVQTGDHKGINWICYIKQPQFVPMAQLPDHTGHDAAQIEQLQASAHLHNAARIIKEHSQLLIDGNPVSFPGWTFSDGVPLKEQENQHKIRDAAFMIHNTTDPESLAECPRENLAALVGYIADMI
jgi:hypothetical protein